MRSAPRFRIMHISDFDYELPPGRIAREPVRPRDASRMMVLDRAAGQWIDSAFRQLPDFLNPSDLLVINDTRVIRARVRGRLERGRELDVLFAGPVSGEAWEVMVQHSKRIRPGDRIVFADGEFEGVFGETRPHGLRLLRISGTHPGIRSSEFPGASLKFLEKHGHIPL